MRDERRKGERDTLIDKTTNTMSITIMMVVITIVMVHSAYTWVYRGKKYRNKEESK